MKIAYCSDVHIEFGSIELKNSENADVLILAGDIFVSEYLEKYNNEKDNLRSLKIHDFFINCSKEFEYIILIAGNHTFYYGDFAKEIQQCKENLKYIKNLYILDNEFIEINNVIFIGSTLWTDMNQKDIKTIQKMKYCMNDFIIIKNSNNIIEYKNWNGEKQYKEAKFTPEDAIEEFYKSIAFIESTIDQFKHKDIVILTHHTPSYKSISPIYSKDIIINGGYHSNCEFLMKSNVKAWIFGHTHARHSYYINNVLLICNPRGYAKHELCADTFKLKTIDLSNRPTKEEIISDDYWEFYPE